MADLLPQTGLAHALQASSPSHGASGMSALFARSNEPHHRLPAMDLAGLGAFLRRIHPRKTADCVEADTGISADTVRNWLKERNGPQVPQLLVLLAVYGPRALTALWHGHVPGWLDASVAATRVAELDRMQAALDAERAALLARPTSPNATSRG